MRNFAKSFEMQYPVEGSIALSPCVDEPVAKTGAIIVFPGNGTSRVSSVDSRTSNTSRSLFVAQPARVSNTDFYISSIDHSWSIGASTAKIPRHAKKTEPEAIRAIVPFASSAAVGLNESDFVRNLREGSMQGVSFNCISRTQSVIMWLFFTLLAFVILFLSL